MKLLNTTIALLALLAPAGAATAGDWGRAPVSIGQAYSDTNCSWCHGPSLQGFTTAPRLAGQRSAYLETQLLNFKNHSRDNPLSKQYMWGATPPVSPEIARELGIYIASLAAEPASDGNRDLAESGKGLYWEGNAAANIVSCAVCHGPEAQGSGAIPKLAGLSYPYLKRRIAEWAKGYHATATAPMPGVAKKLSASDIESIASYLSFVR